MQALKKGRIAAAPEGWVSRAAAALDKLKQNLSNSPLLAASEALQRSKPAKNCLDILGSSMSGNLHQCTTESADQHSKQDC